MMTKHDQDTALVAFGFAVATACAMVYAMAGPYLGGLAFFGGWMMLVVAVLREHLRVDFSWLTAAQLERPTLPDGEDAPVISGESVEGIPNDYELLGCPVCPERFLTVEAVQHHTQETHRITGRHG